MGAVKRVMEIAETRLARRLAQTRIIALAQLDGPEEATTVGAALVRAGLPCLELAAPEVRTIRSARSVDGLLVGVAGVHSAEDAESAARAGAHFATAPATNTEVIHACRELELPFFPGVATPSEIERLVLLGLRTMRVFPAVALGGPAFLQAVSELYPELRFLPSGGIGPESLRSYLDVPSVLAASCSGIVRGDLLRSESYERIEWLARDTVRGSRPGRIGHVRR